MSVIIQKMSGKDSPHVVAVSAVATKSRATSFDAADANFELAVNADSAACQQSYPR
jgi:hypothetical protein